MPRLGIAAVGKGQPFPAGRALIRNAGDTLVEASPSTVLVYICTRRENMKWSSPNRMEKSRIKNLLPHNRSESSTEQNLQKS